MGAGIWVPAPFLLGFQENASGGQWAIALCNPFNVSRSGISSALSEGRGMAAIEGRCPAGVNRKVGGADVASGFAIQVPAPFLRLQHANWPSLRQCRARLGGDLEISRIASKP
jgi:hypothetical protein